MRKILTFLIIFGGTVSCVLMFSIVLYAITPEYRQVVTALVEDDDIPVVTVSQQPVADENIENEETKPAYETKPDSYYKITYIENEPVATESEPTEKEAVITDRQYHEDCGTGKGYWVITYEDGTMEIEYN